MNPASLFTLIGVATVIILAPTTAFGQGDQYAACGLPYRCGDIQNISYPFSVAANRPAYCGYPGFNLSCESNTLMYRYQEILYRVLGIDYMAQRVTVARNDLWDTLCPQTGYFNTSFNLNLFDYIDGGEDQNATLFYGCINNSHLITIPNQFSCTLNGSTTSSYFWRTGTSHVEVDIELCSINIFVPVNQSSAVNLQNSPSVAALRAALRSGFDLRWMAENTLCDRCVQSGGRCGSSTSSPSPTFACYCADRPYPERCNDLNGNEGGSAPPPQGKKKSMNVAVIVVPIVALISITIGACFAWRRGKKKSMNVAVIVVPIVALISTAIGACFAWRRGKKKRGVVLRTTENRVKLEDIPIYSFGKLAAATGNFQSENKLGEGGFGPVYKGTLADGQEIAVKRLSRSSGQGLEEFMNEVVVISKLQHRNLVRLLGCCIEREEKMLVYEFMPNGGLHSLLYDQVRQKYLDWGKRVNIIEGIARGLLYLHRDSRLKIIHRDLKASNILLDQNLNPKISDFGMAKIFGDDKDQEKTGRVVGTYGYMSPEYAMEGSFSEKSDVYSFGVLLLEIVSGRRNSSFYNEEHPWNLSRLAWKLWNEEKILELIDPTICDRQNEREILRCVHVGLLCVQDFAKDRPTVSTALSMLTSETADLPTPKEPAFVERHTSSENQAFPVAEPIFSVNEASITLLQGR